MLIKFILNGETLAMDILPGLPLVDFLREHKRLPGTKIGCREGDCGACAVLEGCLSGQSIRYRTILSCLTPLQNVHGKHIVTIEGLRGNNLSPPQQAIIEHGGTQCGFCTPGFIVSLTSCLLNPDLDPMQAIGGNVCRCTGYKSIEKAAGEIKTFQEKNDAGAQLGELVGKGWLPDYFLTIHERLKAIPAPERQEHSASLLVGGGTDLMVQRADSLLNEALIRADGIVPEGVHLHNDKLEIGGATRITDFFTDDLIRTHCPQARDLFHLFASEPIRNMGTLAGNIVNASPIGDLSVFFLALDARLKLADASGNRRIVKLRDFFLEYKKTLLGPQEYVEHLVIDRDLAREYIHFEKVSKRQFLDIASVNSGIRIKLSGDRIEKIHLAFGGVAPYPFYPKETMEFLKDKILLPELLEDAAQILQQEIAPISDIRGSENYKRLLVRQLFYQHFQMLFPALFSEMALYLLLTETALPYEEH